MPIEYGLGACAIEYDGKNIYVRISDVDDETSQLDFNKLCSPAFYEDKYLLKSGDILVARTGASVGKSYLHNDMKNSYFAGFLMRIRLINHDHYYIYSQLKTSKFKRWLQIMSIRSGQPGINSKELGLFKVHITNLEKEKKIGNILKCLDQRIITQKKIIDVLESLICSIRRQIFNKYNWEWVKLESFIEKGTITLKRGNIIPKHEKDVEYNYPVYSSSIHNNGLMGFNNSYMFDKELITWSIDGGGNFFFRERHKFNVTNVCGIIEVEDGIFNYRFLSEVFSEQHSKLVFDYQTKAHPSIIKKLYKVPIVDIKIQNEIAINFNFCYQKLETEKDILLLYKKQKAYLLQKLFI